MAEYIDKSVLIAMCKGVAAFDWNKKAAPVSWADAYERFADEVEDFDAADVVERKRGRWVWDENAMDWGLGGWVCSECQEKNDNIPAKPDINPYGWVGSFYCPNCGADMREVNDAN